MFNGDVLDVWQFTDGVINSGTHGYIGYSDFRMYFTFTRLGTYHFTYTVNALHDGGTDDDTGDDATHSDTETYTFHVGPIADLVVSDGGSSLDARTDRVAFTVNAVNNGPDHAVGAVVDIDLPRGVRVADGGAIPSHGTYSNGKWDLGELRYTNYRRAATGRAEVATLTLILEGENAAHATAKATISHDDMRPYTVCLEVEHGVGIVEVDATEDECDADDHASWHEGPVYDYRDDNNQATLTARAGAATPPAEEVKPFVALTWLEAEDVGGIAVSHYQVWRSGCDDQEPATVESPRQVADLVYEMAWLDLDVAAGQTYCYQVRAVNTAGRAGPFSRVMERKGREPLAPAASTAGAPDRPALRAAPREGQRRERILLTWEKPNENGWPILSYTLQASDGRGGPWTDAKPQPSSGDVSYIYPPQDQERLTGGTRKYFRLLARNARGDSDWSAVVSETTDSADTPDAPTNVRAHRAGAPFDGREIVVTWRAPARDGGADITGYDVEWSPDGKSGWRTAGRVSTLSFRDTGLGYGTTRHYRVAARNSRGLVSAWSETAAAATAVQEKGASVPAAPANLTLTAGTQHIRASWDAPDDGGDPIKGYRVQYREGTSGAWDELTAFPSGTSVSLHGLPNGVEYQVRVAAVNGAGTGPWTPPESATPYFPPGKPRSLTLTAGVSPTINRETIPREEKS